MKNLIVLLTGILTHELFLEFVDCAPIIPPPPPITNIPSPRSPKNRKTKSPGGFECSSPSSESAYFHSPKDNPQKRKKMVTISDLNEIWTLEKVDSTNGDDIDEIDESESKKFGFDPQLIEPGYDLVSKKDLEPTDSLSFSSINSYEFVGASKPILKVPKSIPQRQIDLIDHFEKGTDLDILQFYSQGMQLLPSIPLHGLFKRLLGSESYEKIRIIYAYDKFAILDFVIKSHGENQIRTLEAIELASIIFSGCEKEEVVLDLKAISAGTTDSFACRAQVFLYAVNYGVDHVYTAVNDLLDNESALQENSDYSKLARELIQRFYEHTKCPLVLSVIEKKLSVSITTILAFDPEEWCRLDKEGRTIFYHAAVEGRDRLLEIDFLRQNNPQKRIPGSCPLIGAAKAGREDSIEYFLVEGANDFNFSSEELEDAAFTSASSGHFSVIKTLLKHSELNMYCYRGSDTLLSVALKNNNIGYAKCLLTTLKYNVNFVGEDSINPDGNALIYLLDKHQTAEFFLQKGANRNVKIPIENPDGVIEYITLDRYLELKPDQKMMKLLDKYK